MERTQGKINRRMDNIGGCKMKKIISTIIILFFVLRIFPYEKIVDWKNNNIKTDKLEFDKNNFLIDNNETISMDNTSYIVFNLSDKQENSDKIKLDNLDTKELLKRANILEKKYPDASMLVLYDDGVQKLNKDGTRYNRSRYSIKIMNEKEIENYSILSFYFLKGRYETNIIMARTISPDGKISYLQKNDIAYTSRTQDLAFFSGRKDEYIIRASVPNVKVGCIVDFEYETIEQAPEDPNQFYTQWFFGGENPIYESKVKFMVPEDKDLYWVIKNIEKWKNDPHFEIKDGFKIYTFITGEIPPQVIETHSPPEEELRPSVFGSVFKDQTYLSNWLAGFMKERLKPTDKMKATVDKVLINANAETEEEKTAALYRFVQEYIHYRSIKTSLSSGLSGHFAEETFNNRYGDCIDKSILFSTLLGIAGVEAYPVILNTNDEARPLYNQIGVVTGNHSITEVHLKEKNKIIYLDTTSTTYKYPVFREDDQGTLAWNPILNTVREIEPLATEWNTQEITKDIALSPDGNGEVKTHVEYSGDVEAGIRGYFLSIKEKEIVSLLYSIIARDYPGSILKEYDYRKPDDYSENLFLQFSYNAKEIMKKSGEDYMIMNIPVSYGFDEITLKERKYALVYRTTEGKKYSIKIKIPEGYRLKGISDSLEINNKYFSYKAGISIDSGYITYKDHFVRTGLRIPPEDYVQYRQDMLKFDYFIKTPLIFEKIKD